MVGDSMSRKLAWPDTVQKLRSRLRFGALFLREMQVLISKGFDFVSHCKKRVGDGHNTQFWYDSWVFDQPLRVRVPRLFALETNKESTVASKLGSSSDLSLVGSGLARSIVLFRLECLVFCYSVSV
uniref:RNA-directed DNA polymerase, eukaryota, reverse transcriptase zinc-binding domain protein n=1 Tax=Tanacetum cinerariifolium TaxID=118510 RepID=A0A6L2MED2_TANCI|nr:RNA-directed DNA polymerase, eukaryota, reverse transcriptase zinc-binding domain protein [Tanacetum cinerariifolium]